MTDWRVSHTIHGGGGPFDKKLNGKRTKKFASYSPQYYLLAIIFITRILIRIFGTSSLDSGINIRKELFVHGYCGRVKGFRESCGFSFLNVELLPTSVVQFRLVQCTNTSRNLKSLACLMPACYTDLRNLA